MYCNRLENSQNPSVFFDYVLTPNMSCTPEQFSNIMKWVLIASVSIGAMFFLSGAWPVIGFLGLDVLLLYIAFKAYKRSAECYERIRLNKQVLEIEVGDAKGKLDAFSYEPTFLNVWLSDDSAQRLVVSQRGEEREIGRLISPLEKEEIAIALKRALSMRKAALVGTV